MATKLQHDKSIMGDKPDKPDKPEAESVEEVEAKPELPPINSADDLKGNARLQDESFEDYKVRRKRENQWTRARLRHGYRRIR